MTLSFYIARRFAGAFGLLFAVFLVMLMLLDMIEQIRRFAGGSVSFGQSFNLAMLNMPATLYRILPLVVILASLALFLNLARTSELVVIRAAGRSALRTLAAPVLTALVIGIAAVAVMNPIVAATSRQYEALANEYALGGASVLSISAEGLWLRQGGEAGQTVIHADRANLDGTQLFDVSFTTFSPDAGPTSRIEAASAQLTPGAWIASDAKVWTFAPGTNSERSARSAATLTLPSDLTIEQIRDSFGKPEAIAIYDLPAFISQLDRAGFSARRHRVWFQTELAMPLLLAAMVLVAAGFTMRHTRLGQTGPLVLLALLAGFAIFFLRNFTQVLGENGHIPVLLAAWSPPVAAVLLSLGLLLHLEDG